MTKAFSDLFLDFKTKLATFSKVLIAYSGGVDSSVLLHLCVKLKQVRPDFSVRAVYVHHGLSQYADDWAEHCEKQCRQFQIPFKTLFVTLPTIGNIEAQAREARYQAIGQHITHNEVLLTAQHLDDQCETFLLALKRGSGPAGLSAMPERMKHDTGFLLYRPLLSTPRAIIELYAKAYQLSWIEDDSNTDARFDRNFLRLCILPLLTERWPHFADMVVRSATLCAEQESLIDELLEDTLSACIDQEKSLDINQMQGWQYGKVAAVLRRWLALQGISMPSRAQLQTIWQEVALSKQDADPQYLLNDYQIRRYQRRLYVLPRVQDVSQQCLLWQMTETLILPDGLGQLMLAESDFCVRLPRAEEEVTVRFAYSGVIDIVGRDKSRKLKKLWQELRVPPWHRQRIPLLFYNDQLIAAISVFVTKAGKVENDNGCSIKWVK